MTSLIEQLGIDKLATLRALETVDQISAGLHGYDDNGPVRVSIRPDLGQNRDEDGNLIIPDDKATLITLASHKIITYRYSSIKLINDMPKKAQIYRVCVTNRYKFEQLVVELDKQHSNRFTKLGHSSVVDNLIYYNPSTGDVSANGARGKIKQGTKYKNRAIFGLLLRCAPRPAPRDEILKILKLTSETKYTDKDRTYGINHAIDSLRDALEMKSDVISLKADGVHLNAIIVQVEQLPEDFRFTE